MHLSMQWQFIPHRQYIRREEILIPFGGGWQGGMATAPRSNAIFLFTGAGGKSSGYVDGFLADGRFRYTGEGRTGDQQFTKGNRALRDHQNLSWDVLLFEKVRATPSVTFLGQFICDSYELERQTGADGKERDAIVFFLTPFEEAELAAESDDNGIGEELIGLDLVTLRKRAYAAAGPAMRGSAGKPRSVYKRSQDVKSYVLARASGFCEACVKPAPFMTKVGEPYLEPHHIDRLSDGGPDSPDRVAGICPNCHREVHHGAAGAELNAQLRALIKEIETNAD
jgi:5-methylcytosine-specific restriction protein A